MSVSTIETIEIPLSTHRNPLPKARVLRTKNSHQPFQKWKCQPISPSPHKSKGCPPYTQKTSAYFSICPSFCLWCLYLGGVLNKEMYHIKMGSRQAEHVSMSLCGWWALQLVIAHQHRGRWGTGRPLRVSYTEAERRAQPPKKHWANEEPLSPLVPCKAFQLACLLLSLPFMPRQLLAMLTNYCSQTSCRKTCKSEDDRKDTLSAWIHEYFKPQYFNYSGLKLFCIKVYI